MRAWLKVRYSEGVGTLIPVLVQEEHQNENEVVVELPWTDEGEPAQVLRRGLRTSIPVSELVIADDDLVNSCPTSP